MITLSLRYGQSMGTYYKEARLRALNDSTSEAAYYQFRRCCGSSKWAREMVEARPFLSSSQMEQTADRVWAACSRRDWLEAFAAHPRIGQQSHSRWASQEQSGVTGAPSEVHAALDEANKEYEAKFGYIFIVCAAGKTAGEMFAMLQDRIGNDPSVEIENAAEQQRMITRLRLRKLLSE